MREGDLSLFTSSLQYAMKSLNTRWNDAQDSWQDNVARKFGEEYIDPIAPQMNVTLKAINRLAAILARAREECS